MRENTPRRKGRVIAGPCLREKKLPQRPRSAIGTTGTGDRQEAMLSVLKPEQRAVYQAEQQRRRDETAKTLDGIGLTLPADWDMLNDY